MSNSTSPNVKKQVNNLCAKIKARYPHLYQETGGKLIRKTLMNMLEANYATYDESPSSAYQQKSELLSADKRKNTQDLRYKHLQQKAA
jgi:hypothetical protein